MQVDRETVRQKFDSVSLGECSRESASDWAREMRQLKDAGELVITPVSDVREIWEALSFLEMYDMKNSPTEFMYGEEDLTANRP